MPVRTLVFLLALAACEGRITGPAAASPEVAEPTVDAPGQPGATPTPTPTPGIVVAPQRALRQLSLDLTGRLPSEAHVAAVTAAGEVPAAIVDELLGSPEFLSQVTGWHAELLWPNLSRYRVNGIPLYASPSRDLQNDPLTASTPFRNIRNPLADPLLWTNEVARQSYGVSFQDEAFTSAFRGGAHAYGAKTCDLSDEWEYPDPSAVGTPANRYTVPAAKSGTGQAYTRTYYSEDPGSRGAVLPLYTPKHCPNFCRKLEARCIPITTATTFSFDPVTQRLPGCYREMDTPGDDPAGRHELDAPGMRCADGYVREVNRCHFWDSTIPGSGGEVLPGIRGRRVQRADRPVSWGNDSFNNQVEGWRWMVHYWSNGKPIKTCALEAQEREFGLYVRTASGQPVRCDQATAGVEYFTVDSSCGCGPRGTYCQPVDLAYRSTLETRTQVNLRTSLEQEPLELIRQVVAADRPYFDILTTRQTAVNGPLATAWRYQAPVLRGEGFKAVTGPGFTDPRALEPIAYEDASWRLVEREARHAGVLTTLGFLIRFPTSRARVAQYRRAFLCSTEFDYAPTPDPTDTNPDLAARVGCSSCHRTLETEGLYFGRYPDRVAEYRDPGRYPLTDMSWQQPFVHRTATERARLDQGPSAMVQRDLAGSALVSCTARTAAKRLLQREPTPEEQQTFEARFREGGLSYRALIKAIVTSAGYLTEEAP
ncbi:MAG: hypothetical protein SFW67_17885 [Myxococcaceae bacterium]|nr:hypothetical protein [Myxococcaceae bacterium]